jgi:GntR family transcriptional repressor for pyruvate dehydrogenase complex
LSVLQSRGFIESRPGGATIVCSTPDTAAGVQLAEQLARSGPAIRNPLEVRYIFEPQTAYLAAQRATEGEIAVMAGLIRTQERVVASGGTGLEQDTAFHFAIAGASHNDLLVTIVSYINEALRETREWSLRARAGSAASIRHHHCILSAIASHDAPGAQAAMAKHLEDVQVMALLWLKERAVDLTPERDLNSLLGPPPSVARILGGSE